MFRLHYCKLNCTMDTVLTLDSFPLFQLVAQKLSPVSLCAASRVSHGLREIADSDECWNGLTKMQLKKRVLSVKSEVELARKNHEDALFALDTAQETLVRLSNEKVFRQLIHRNDPPSYLMYSGINGLYFNRSCAARSWEQDPEIQLNANILDATRDLEIRRAHLDDSKMRMYLILHSLRLIAQSFSEA